MQPSAVVTHCQPSLLNSIKELGLNWDYSDIHDHDEIDVVVDNIPYEITRGDYQDPDEELCTFYGIDYDQVNCIEALY